MPNDRICMCTLFFITLSQANLGEIFVLYKYIVACYIVLLLFVFLSFILFENDVGTKL